MRNRLSFLITNFVKVQRSSLLIIQYYCSTRERTPEVQMKTSTFRPLFFIRSTRNLVKIEMEARCIAHNPAVLHCCEGLGSTKQHKAYCCTFVSPAPRFIVTFEIQHLCKN